MTAATQQLERSIRELPVQEMVALHASLVAAIHEAEDAKGLDLAFRQEIRMRVDSIESGRATRIDAFKALQKM